MVKGEDPYTYQSGLLQEFASETRPHALPALGNTPQKVPYDLYAEQLSGSAFTAPRVGNQKVWLYRAHPSVGHYPFEPSTRFGVHVVSDFSHAKVDPSQLRWNALPLPGEPGSPFPVGVTFLEGLVTVGGSGSTDSKKGCAAHLYVFDAAMGTTAFCNADGDMLLVPQLGALDIRTELGRLRVRPGEIAVVQRGIRWSVDPAAGPCRGYILEVYQGHFRLPELGPIGANGLANPRDFQTPVAWEDGSAPQEGAWTIVHKFLGAFFEAKQPHSPFDVVAWHGNYAPYKYDLDRFCVVNAVLYDHLDPSIFTVLTCPSDEPGTAVADFVIFPPRWCVQEDTFRPPYFHRNCMTEYMGLIRGVYDAKADGFVPGGASLHSCMTPHGPDRNTYEKAVAAQTNVPVRMEDTMAFMFESCYLWRLTGKCDSLLQKQYYTCWQGIKDNFHGKN